MKLPDFTMNAGLNQLRQAMKANLTGWNAGWDKQHINIDEILITSGIEIPPDKIGSANDGTLEYAGRKVVVYIRDQSVPGDSNREQLSKFHIADCTTLQEMRMTNRYERYVVTTRKDGLFIVNFPDRGWSQTKNESVKLQLHVCKNCLRRLNYKNYSRFRSKNASQERRKNEIRDSFNLEEFFHTYTSQITKVPPHTDLTAPLNEYSPARNQISKRYREKRQWKCENCHIALGHNDGRKFLHVHHQNGVKSDNSEGNLRALCLRCHAEMPQHHHMKSLPVYREFMAKFHRR